MTSTKECMDCNLRRSLCHTMAETYGKVISILYLQLPASLPNWITGSERSLMALNNKLLAKPQSLKAVCLQEAYIY